MKHLILHHHLQQSAGTKGACLQREGQLIQVKIKARCTCEGKGKYLNVFHF